MAGKAFETGDGSEHRNWHDLGAKCGRDPQSMVAVDILSRKPLVYGVVFWTETGAPFHHDALQLITFYRLFSQTILSTAYLVRELTRDRARALESSSRLADAETMAALADMSSGVAHDFNNILGGIIGRLQILKLKCQDESVVSALDRLEANALEGSETVRKLQQFTTSVKTKQMKPLDLAALVQAYAIDTRAIWKSLAEKKQVNVEFRLTLPEASVKGVPEDLITLLEHTILNAVEFAPEGTTVPVDLSESGPNIVLNIADTGAGIPEGIRSRIFYPFFTTKSAKGAGMGLAIVYGIVGRHGGKITFESEIGHGTVFTITLPKDLGHREASDISRKILTAARLNILVVDDDEQIREVLGDMLSLDGHSSTRCRDGYEALKKFESEKYDMVVTDLGMPGMSGLDLAAIVHEKNPAVPIAMITGWGMQLDHDEMAIKGIKTVLSKPFHLKDVKAMVSELTGAAPVTK
jgi:signal transduction histidine kinase/ActR/RegA family two-component response regulator